MNAPAYVIERETGAAKALADALRQAGADEDDLICDMIEGETDAMEAASRLLRWMGERGAQAEALKALEADYATRRKRFEAGVQSGRQALMTFMDLIGVKKLERPEATLSLREGGVTVIYAADFDAEKLDEGLQKWTCAPDKAAVKEWLAEGKEVPGAALSNSPPVLTVRTK